MEKRRWNDDLEVEERKIEDQARLAERWQYWYLLLVLYFGFSLFFPLESELPKYFYQYTGTYGIW